MITEQSAGRPVKPAATPPRGAPGASGARPDAVTRAYAMLTERAVSLYAAAALRIGYGLVYLVFLLREFPHRDEIWGPGSPWTPALARELSSQSGWFSILTLSDAPEYFEACYALAVVASVLFMLGWCTRAVSVLFAVMVVSFHGRDIYMVDGGDNLIVLVTIYLAFTACGRRWSLDARRSRLRAAGRGRAPLAAPAARVSQQAELVCGQLTNVLHNCAMFVIAAQVCVLYGAAGLYKVQGGTWRGGTAMHYVLNLGLFRPWPALSQAADSHPVLLAVASYATVLVQVAFPFALFSKLKYPVLGLLFTMHLSIAVMLGLPVFSGAMIVADLVFLPDRLLMRLAQRFRSAMTGQPSVTKGGARCAADRRPRVRPRKARADPD